MSRLINLTGANQVISSAPTPIVYYRGFAVRETTGVSTALIRVWDSASAASGTRLDEISLAPNESAREMYDPPRSALAGVFIEVVSGTVVGELVID